MIVADELKKFPLFKSVEPHEIEALGRIFQRQSIPAGTVLFEKDDPGETMYLIQSGRIRVFLRDPEGSEITFRHYGPGEIVGEFALIDDKPRSASACADEPVEVMMLNRENFLKILKERPMLGVEMMRSLAERIRYTTNYLERLFDAINLLGNNEFELAIREMAISTDENQIQSLIHAFVVMVDKLREQETIQ